VDYFNVTKRVGLDPPSKMATYKLLMAGAGICVAGIAGTVVAVLLAIRSIHGWSDLPAVLKYVVVGLPSVFAACIGFALLIVGIMFGGTMMEFRRAVVEETDTTPRQ
jgi:hypothetical protein